MPLPTRVDVHTASRQYTVLIGQGLLAQLSRVLDESGLGSRRVVVSNPTVWGHWGSVLRQSWPAKEPVLVPDGEQYKTLHTVTRVYEALFQARADRETAIVTFGGGVVGDLAGFAAASYLRGLGLAHVPTTLLAQVDAAVGGKVGVNLPGGKNLVGAFYQPWVVVSDQDVLQTLPRREFRAGLYEIVKYGVACSRDLFERLHRDLGPVTKREAGALAPVIAESCRIKAAIVVTDEREAGARRVLNFGHTAGHALEAVTRYRRFLHGEAVACGMLVACEIARGRGLLSGQDHGRLESLLGQLGPLPTLADLRASDIVDAMRADKKSREGRLTFVLPVAIGQTTIVDDVEDEEIARALVACGLSSL
ncbi:MAG: 3-dehydroquinate synthase [Acidobacteriota bacterium]